MRPKAGRIFISIILPIPLPKQLKIPQLSITKVAVLPNYQLP